MEPLSVETTLDVRDWHALLRHLRSRAYTTQLNRSQIFGAAFGLLALVVGVLAIQYLMHGRAHTGSIFMGTVLGIGLMVGAARLQGKWSSPAPDASWFELTRFRIDETGVRAEQRGYLGHFEWRKIHHVAETSDHIFIAVSEYSAYTIPKRCITATQPTEFFARIQAWYAQRETAPPMTAPVSTTAAEQSPLAQSLQSAIVPTAVQPPGFWRALGSNLVAGLRIFVLRGARPGSIVPTFDQIVALLAIVLSVWIALDWLRTPGPVMFSPWGVGGLFAWLMLGFWLIALIARTNSPASDTRPLLVAVLATAPWLIVVAQALTYLPVLGRIPLALAIAVAAIALAPGFRALHAAYKEVRPRASIALFVALVALVVIDSQLYLNASLWRPDVSDEEQGASWDWDAGESILFEEKSRISSAADQLAAERPGVTDVFYIGFAGDGSQRVFRREALFGERVFGERMASASRSLELINDEDDLTTYPLGTLSGLRYAISQVGERMNIEEDVLVLLLTSHGGKESGIQVSNGVLSLNNVDPETLRSALDDARIKWRIVIVSACYSGTFMEPLRNESTMVITAADAEHTSFGCSDERDLTYFGEAFLRDALPNSTSLEDAFEIARKSIAERERAEDLTPSNPQIFVGKAIREKLAALGDLPWSGSSAR